jgi:hypothetical protein
MSISFIPIATFAQSPQPYPANSGQCDGNEYFVAIPVAGFDASGAVYVRLNTASETTTPINVYFRSTNDIKCTFIGSGMAKLNTWSKISDTGVTGLKDGIIIISYTVTENVEVYQGTFQMLFVSDKKLCTITANCETNFNGYKGTLSADTSSRATDDILLFRLTDIDGVAISKVDYYDGGTFLYSSAKLESVNRNYLPGGNRQLTKQVYFKNGQILTITETVNMGYDFSGGLAIRSYIYRSKNRSLVIGIIVAAAVLSLLILLFIHYLVRRHYYKIDHGLDKSAQIAKRDYSKADESLHIMSGKL